ncbi:cation diffusion facilitator family transporter [Amnibacterium sp.]|uniref:cation diffusion facilitator family transporter n=1 Tax=Amnibacterium sp. TaxID=1872496 RepID=UPI00345CC2E1
MAVEEAEERAQEREGTGGESAITVLVALGANLLIAIAKTVAALITASASMLAEAAHSWADTGNEVFLFIAGRRAAKPPTTRHPLGFGRDTYVWSLFAAVGLFTVGAAVSVLHGIGELGVKGPAADPLINYIVLAVSFVLEGVSFLRAFQQVRRSAGAAQQDLLDYALTTSDPTVRAVVFEDAAALVGIVIAAAGVALHQVTGRGVWDAAGSIAVGVVLGLTAILLIQQNRRFLIGEAVDPRVRASVLGMLLQNDDVLSVTYLHLEYVGPGLVFLVAAVDLTEDAPEHEVAVRLRRLAQGLEERPHVRRAILTLSVPGDAPAVP